MASLVACLLALSTTLPGGPAPAASALAQADAGLDAQRSTGPTPCAIDGRAPIAALAVERSHRGRSALAHLDVPAREVRVRVLTPSLFHVETRLGEPALEGHTQVRPPLSLRVDVSLSGALARRGAPIGRTTPREQSLDVDIELGEGVSLRRVVLGCDSLRVREAAHAQLPTPPSARHPRWVARGRELALRARPEEGIEAARLSVTSALVLEERARRPGFVRVRAGLAHGELDGWVRESSLVPAR